MEARVWLLLCLAIWAYPNRLFAGGGSELDKALRDRPILAPVLQKHPSVRAWLVEAFEGKFSKVKISWRDDDAAMRTPFAEHSYDEHGAFIIVSRKLTAIDQLTAIVYECVSVQHQDSWNELWSSPANHKLDRDAFVLAARQLEHQISVETKKILQRCLEPAPVEVREAPIYANIMNGIEDFQTSLNESWEGARYYQSVYDSLVSTGVMRPPD